MAKTLNRVQLIGRLGGDPEMKVTPSDLTVTSFSVATNRQWKNKDGELQEETDWHNIVAWDKLGEICGEHLTKGRLVFIEGRLRTRNWEQNGQKQYRTEVVASDMLILDGRGGGAVVADGDTDVERSEPSVAASRARMNPSPQPISPSMEDADELPF